MINLYDYERAARDALETMAWDYYDSGANDEITLRENHAAYDRLTLRYRVLRDVSVCDPTVSVLGHELAMPALIAPTAFHGLAHDDAEKATAAAAGDAGTVMILSTLSNTPMEHVTAAATGPVWFQLYVYRDREVTADLVRRAVEAGCGALVLTVDAPVIGTRERDVRNGFHLPSGLTVANAVAEIGDTSGSELAAYVMQMFDPSLSWADLEWLRGLSDLPVLVKGVVHPDDGRLAVEHGATGVIVSNHGGRQLDTAPATIDVLPEVADAARSASNDVTVLVDGGVRRGTDVVKAIALGADAVCVGRPVLWGLAVDGREGVTGALDILRAEFVQAMALCGCRTVDEIRAMGRDLVAH